MVKLSYAVWLNCSLIILISFVYTGHIIIIITFKEKCAEILLYDFRHLFLFNTWRDNEQIL